MADIHYIIKDLVRRFNFDPNADMDMFLNPKAYANSAHRRASRPGLETQYEEDFDIKSINDFTSEEIKFERAKYEESGLVPATQVCSAYHGGALDYPKMGSRSLVEICEKWELCFDQLEAILRERRKQDALKRVNSDEQVYAQLTDQHSKGLRSLSENKPDLDGDDDEVVLPEDAFYSSISESASKICIHNMRLCKDLLAVGDMTTLFSVLGGLALVRNCLWHYNEYLELKGTGTQAFQDQYSEICEMMEAVSEQVLQYHSAMVAVTILHDSASGDWDSDRAFYEGEKISHSVQMWWYFLQGFKQDLWSRLPPKMAHKMMAQIVSESMSILTARYATICYRYEARKSQFIGDILAILLISSEVLTWLTPSVDQLFRSDPQANASVSDIHSKCSTLYTILTVTGAPVMALEEACNEVKRPKFRSKKKHLLSEARAKTLWLCHIRADIFTNASALPWDKLSPLPHIILLAKMTANQPEPSWPLLVQTLLSHDLAVSKLILLHFGAFVPGVRGEQPPVLMTDGCDGYKCRRECLGAADLFWPQVVGSGVLRIAMIGFGMRGHPKILCQLMDPLLTKLGTASWEALNKSNIWNPWKPVWLQAVIQLVEPLLKPVVLDLFEMIAAGKAWTLNHVQPTIKAILASVEDIIPLIPEPALHLMAFLQERYPKDTTKPLCGSVATHVLVTGLYGIVSRLQPILKKSHVQREKLDFIIAFGEALCSLETSAELLKIQNAVDSEFAEETEFMNDRNSLNKDCFDNANDSYAHTLAELTANDILAEESGALALKALYRFLCYNVEWVESCMWSTSPESSCPPRPVLIQPWGSEIFPPQSSYSMMNRIGACFSCDNAVDEQTLWESRQPPNLRARHTTNTDKDNTNNYMHGIVPETDNGYLEMVRMGQNTNQLSAEGLTRWQEKQSSQYASKGTFHFYHIMGYNHPWDVYLRHVLLYGNPGVVSRVFSKRPELDKGLQSEYSKEECDRAEKMRHILEQRLG